MRLTNPVIKLKAPGYRPIITQLYDRACEYVGNDVAFLVKDSLLIDFKPVENNPKTDLEVAYNFKLVDANAAETTETPKGML